MKKIRKRDLRQKKSTKQEAVSQAVAPVQVSSTVSVSATVQKRQKKDPTVTASGKIEQSLPDDEAKGELQQN